MVASPHSLSKQHAFRGRLQFSHRFIGFNLGKHVAAFHARSLLDSPGEQLALFNGCSHVRQPNGNCHLPTPLSDPAESANAHQVGEFGMSLAGMAAPIRDSLWFAAKYKLKQNRCNKVPV